MELGESGLLTSFYTTKLQESKQNDTGIKQQQQQQPEMQINGAGEKIQR